MNDLNITLFGKFSARQGEQVLEGLGAGKVQELFCYLLLHRGRPCPREALASVLWGHGTTAQSKAYLRRALWKLRSTLEDQACGASGTLLSVSADWVQCDAASPLWLDVAQFEAAYERVEGKAGAELSEDEARSLQAAVELYDGDLLENYYQEWCLYERERLRHHYLVLLDKLTSYFQARRQYERAVSTAECILGHDRARERTHRQLMLLRMLSGDRTGALHQYRRCVAALRRELDVDPSDPTRRLYERIRDGEIVAAASKMLPAASTREALDELQEAFAQLTAAQEQMRLEIEALARRLSA